ncbi:unnamed protein product, partial [Didymodactylos carnosus]
MKRRTIFFDACFLVLLVYTVQAQKSHRRHAPIRTSKVQQLQDQTTTSQRLDCFPEAAYPNSGFSEQACLARNCLFDAANSSGRPQCYLPPNYGYELQSAENRENGMRLYLKKTDKVQSPFPIDVIENVILDVEYYSDQILRFKLYDKDKQRYEVPIPLNPPSSSKIQNPSYEFTYSSNSSNDNLLSFFVKRRSTGQALFDTSLGGLILSDQFLQIVTRLQSPHVYGFGENNHDTLKHQVKDSPSWGLFAASYGTNTKTNTNHYGTHPFYLVMEQNSSTSQPTGNMHGVLFLNSNAMDYTFSPTPSLTLRTIGGVLDFFVFMGPEPEEVVKQYTWLVGRPMLPPYWGLGFQLSRWDYGNITHLKNVVQRNLDKGIPLDVQYSDIDYMDADKDFTVDPKDFVGLKEYYDWLHSKGLHTIIILDPGVIDDQLHYQPTITGMKEDVFIKWDDGSGRPIKGSCWPGDVYFPDFFLNRTKQWWTRWITDFHAVNLTFDGLWIDMNEPC